MAFSRQEYWSGLPFPSPGDLPHPATKPGPPAPQAGSLSPSHQGSKVWRKRYGAQCDKGKTVQSLVRGKATKSPKPEKELVSLVVEPSTLTVLNLNVTLRGWWAAPAPEVLTSHFWIALCLRAHLALAVDLNIVTATWRLSHPETGKVA